MQQQYLCQYFYRSHKAMTDYTITTAPACSTTRLTNACKEQCVPEKGILTDTLFAATPQQTHSLHLRMLLDPHNRQHLPKTWKTLPSLFVRLISYDIKCTSSCQSFDHVTVRHVWDDPGILFVFVHRHSSSSKV